MQDISKNPYSRCINPECGKKYWGWAEKLEPCGCGSPTERYAPSVEEIRESNRRNEGVSATYPLNQGSFPIRRINKWE